MKRGSLNILALVGMALVANVGDVCAQNVTANPPSKVDNDVIRQNKKDAFDSAFFLALQCKLAGNLDAAMDALSKCQQFDPKSAAVYYEAAQILGAKERYTYAADYMDRALELDTVHVKEYLDYAVDVNLAANRYLRVLTLQDSVLARYGENTQVVFDKVEVLKLLKRYEEALAQLEALDTRKDGEIFEAELKKCEIYGLLLKPKKSLKILAKLNKKHPNNAKVYANMARYYAMLNDDDEALKYIKLSTEAPEGAAFLFNYADLSKALGQDSLYAQTFIKALRHHDIIKEAKTRRVYALISDKSMVNSTGWRGFIEKALNVFADENPDAIESCLMQLQFYNETGNYAMSYASAKRYVESNPANEAIWAEFFKYTDLSGEALLPYAARAAQDVPENPYFALVQGETLYLLGRYAESSKICEENLDFLNRLDSSDPKVMQFKGYFLHQLAQNYWSVDSVKQTFAVYDHLLSMDPDDVVALNNYSYFLALKGGDLEKCETMIRKCINLSPGNPTYLDTYAYVLFLRKKYLEALFIIERCMSATTDPSYEILDHYGDILYFNNRQGDALTIWKRALNLVPDNELIGRKVRDNKYYAE